jgi:hypothetical protein
MHSTMQNVSPNPYAHIIIYMIYIYVYVFLGLALFLMCLKYVVARVLLIKDISCLRDG